eukprot:TRINITY_DN44437_c0_g1_i1.p1 TRINITY_DN44437_c0_g1~~TRINITY_DN44437_c0_g1_i1.p1  ORF type:complete len:247 (+),score=41.75 TRINITY_DN44437_c0_g1_i1:42-743(+)
MPDEADEVNSLIRAFSGMGRGGGPRRGRRGGVCESDLETVTRQFRRMRVAGAGRAPPSHDAVMLDCTPPAVQRFAPYRPPAAVAKQLVPFDLASFIARPVEVSTADGSTFEGTLTSCGRRAPSSRGMRARIADAGMSVLSLQLANCRLKAAREGHAEPPRLALTASSRLFSVGDVKSIRASGTSSIEVLDDDGAPINPRRSPSVASAPPRVAPCQDSWMDYLTVARGLERLSC